MMDVRIERHEPRRVIAVAHRGPYAGIAQAYGTLCGWAGRKGLIGPGTQVLGMYFDDPKITPPEELRALACITWPEGAPVELEPPMEEHHTPGGEHAVFLHVGSYETLAETYEAVMGQWLPTSGRGLADAPSFEIYLDDPETTPEERLRTEIHLVLQPSD